jgi:hypothetical protein
MQAFSSEEAPARVLAMMVAANGRIDASELRVLQEHDAFRRLRVSRERFVALVHAYVEEIGVSLCERSWLCTSDEVHVDALLDTVTDPELRLLICTLADAVIAADGTVSHGERLLHDHALARWRISRQRLSELALEDVPAG